MRKNVVRILALVLAVLILAGALASIMNFANAQSIDIDKGVYAYGAGLTLEEAEKTKVLLEIQNEDVDFIQITGQDALKYINENNQDSQMISSIFAKKNDDNVLKVEVMTPLMITDVSSLQYSNAAVTAGINNLDIKVASVSQVTGTSALTGVYKLVEMLGQEVDVERTTIANEEIQTINVIAKEHENDENFSKEDLNNAVVEGKKELVEIKESEGVVTADKIDNVVQTVVKDNNLENVLNNNNIQSLNMLFTNFINIENLNIDVTKSQLEYLKDNAEEFAKEEIEKVKEFLNSDSGKEFLNGLSDNMKEGFENAINSAKNGLNSKNLEDALKGLRENIDTENIQNFINDASNSLENNAGGFFSAIGDIFRNIFNAIGEFFRSLFN